jgi:hypothetical protein
MREGGDQGASDDEGPDWVAHADSGSAPLTSDDAGAGSFTNGEIGLHPTMNDGLGQDRSDQEGLDPDRAGPGEENPAPSQEDGPAVDWEAPLPLGGEPAPFPVEALSEWMGRFVSELAHATQTPVDLAGMLSLAVIASTLAKRVAVLVKPDWTEPLCLYVVAALPPASRKSAVFGEVTAPLREHERRELERLAPEIEIAKADQEQIRQRREKAASKARRAKDDATRAAAEAEAEALSREMTECKVPVAPRLIVDDITSERLGMLLEEHGGGSGCSPRRGRCSR